MLQMSATGIDRGAVRPAAGHDVHQVEALEGVEAAEVSHEAGTAIVSMSAEVADAALKEAVEAKDYKVAGIE